MKSTAPRLLILLGAIAGVLLLGAALGMPKSEPASVAEYVMPIVRDNTPLDFPYCATEIGNNEAIRTLILVIHGDARNACEYANWAVQSADLAGTIEQTLVIAPSFLTEEDLDPESENLLYWSEGGWKSGSLSQDSPESRPWRVSSFAALDEIIALARAQLPSLEEIVVVGHSAGGQFTNRYAAISSVVDDIRFVISNPSSYLYLDSRRWDGETFDELTDSELDDCPDANDYKYGLSDLHEYPEEIGRSQIREQYGARQVTYLLSGGDDETSGPSLDVSCAAEWQGPSRLQRGLTFFHYLGTVYGPEIYSRHQLSVIPSIGHEAEAVLASPQGQRALFGENPEPLIDSD